MAKILDSRIITGKLQKIVETSLGYIINGAYYDKNQMIPKPLQLFTTMGDIEDLSMSQKLMLNHKILNRGKTMGDTIVTDRDDPSICYVWTMGARDYNSINLFKLKEENGSATILQSRVNFSGTNWMIRGYMGQDSEYLYYMVSSGPSNYYQYVIKVNKITLAYSNIESVQAYSWGSSIKETDTYIYYGIKRRYGEDYIKRYNKTSGVSEILCNNKISKRDFVTCYSDVVSLSDTTFINFSLYYNDTKGTFGITKHHFDISKLDLKEIYTEIDCNIIWGEDIIKIPVLNSNYLYYCYEPFITTINNNMYLNIAIYEQSGNDTPGYIRYYGIYTFLIEPDTQDLIFKSFTQVTSEIFRGFLGIKNNTFLIGASDNTCYFMNFDKQKEKFVISDSLSNKPYHIGIDQSENIWIMNSLYEVEMLTPFVPTNVNIDYESQGYQYKGEDIYTYITIEAKNYNGVNIASDLQLTIKGNAVFSSNGTKTLSDTTLTTGVKYIPIIIKGAGAVTVYPQLIM